MFTLTKTLTDWITWSSSNVEDEWKTWEQWQRHQPLSHYEKSDIFQYYLTRSPDFKPPQNSCLNGYNKEYYVYCFGDFACLVVSPHTGGDILKYISLLLDIYDTCKGYTRKIKGDPKSISMLRKVVLTKNLTPLKDYDHNTYCYPYNTLHAHTVSQYSLSTLIMRLISHYLSQTAPKGYYQNISVSLCKQAYDNSIFGAVVTPRKNSSIIPSLPISIPVTKATTEEVHGYSWPANPPIGFNGKDIPKCLRCKICTRVCENIWGKFDVCIDCHLKRICSTCSKAAVIIATDGLPKCHEHT